MSVCVCDGALGRQQPNITDLNITNLHKYPSLLQSQFILQNIGLYKRKHTTKHFRPALLHLLPSGQLLRIVLLVRAIQLLVQTLARPAARRLPIGQAHAVRRTAAVVHLAGTVEQRAVVGDGRQREHAMVGEERYVDVGQPLGGVVNGLDAFAVSGKRFIEVN